MDLTIFKKMQIFKGNLLFSILQRKIEKMFEIFLTNSNVCCMFSLEHPFFVEKKFRTPAEKSGFWDYLYEILYL